MSSESRAWWNRNVDGCVSGRAIGLRKLDWICGVPSPIATRAANVVAPRAQVRGSTCRAADQGALATEDASRPVARIWPFDIQPLLL